MKPGDSFGRYRIEAEIATGGMGIVYKAYDTTLRRSVAVKLLLSNRAPVDAERLLHEARMAAALNHPNICTVHEVSDVGGQLCIVMEYIEGRALSRILPEQPLPVETIIHYGTQIADALAHAHDRGVIHRDLKSANVMATPAGRVKVLDFGLASYLETSDVDAITRSASTLSVRPTLEGSLPFMAPEVLRGERPDERSDIWSAGVVLYEMAVGARPFHGRTAYELTAAILLDLPAPVPVRVPSNLSSVIRRCLEKQPGMRYQRASELLAALQATQVEVATEMRVGDSSNRYPAPVKRYAVAVLATAVVLSIIGAGGWFLNSRVSGTPAPGPRDTAPARLDPQVRGDRVSIVEISPQRGTLLQRGSTVTIRVTLRYELLTADSATIAMVVQDTSNRRYTLGSLPQPRAVISKGMGSVMLSDTFTIPMLATPVDGLSEVTVHFPLSLPGALQTSLVATASYPLQ